MPKITIQQTEEQHDVFIAEGKTLLAGLELSGSTIVPVGCRGGGCGVCRVNVVAGQYETKKMSRVHVSEDDEKSGKVLACRTLPQSDLVITLATPETVINQQRKTQATKIILNNNEEV